LLAHFSSFDLEAGIVSQNGGSWILGLATGEFMTSEEEWQRARARGPGMVKGRPSASGRHNLGIEEAVF